MPIDYSTYPEGWKTLSVYIRTVRAQNRCEWCGVENYSVNPVTGARVVLTVAHINQDITDNREDNLAALCQACHLKHDADQHAKNAGETRRKKKISVGQLVLIEG